ncbi:MAG TPA: PHP domain-containing protein [Chloroflexia bacterium]|nr:PHP domain-containing protein [Chloroflexia bacterium]
MTDASLSPVSFAYLHVRTAYGPGGGPGPLAGYAAAAQGLAALACTDYGSVAAWPEWERVCRKAGIRPLYGLVFDLILAPAAGPPWPVLALAATGEGLRNLVRLHNNLARAADGRCTLDSAALPSWSVGLWLILLPAGDRAPAPLAALPRRDVLPAVARLAALLARPEALLCGLPPHAPDQDYFAELARAADLRAVALPVVRYPRPDDAPAHAVLRTTQLGPPPLHDADGVLPDPGAPGSGELRTIDAPAVVAGRYAGHPDAFALAGMVAASCQAVLADLAPAGPPDPRADAVLAGAVDEVLAARGRDRDPALAAELTAVRRLGSAASLLAAYRVVTTARGLDLLLGASGGFAAQGRVPALLGLCLPDPFGAPPRWLEAPAGAPGWMPLVTVAAARRETLLAYLQEHAAIATLLPGYTLAEAGGHGRWGPAAAVAALGQACAWAPARVAALEAALLAPRADERSRQWRAALADHPAAQADHWLQIATALETMPGPPLADGEALVVLPPTACLPLRPPVLAGGRGMAAWSAADCAQLGAAILLLRGDPDLDCWDRAQVLAGGPVPPVSADDLRLVLTSGEIAGLPLPMVPEGDALETTPDVLAALCAALIPDDPLDVPAWAALGALLYNARGPHPWLRTYLRRRVGSAPVTYRYPALGAVLDLTAGLPLYCEQLAILQLLLHQEDAIPRTGILQLEEWLGQAQSWATDYALAVAAATQLHRALRLKIAAPAAFLAATLESAVAAGDTLGVQALALEARRRGVDLRPPAVQTSLAGFTLEAPPALGPGEGAGGRRPAGASRLPAVRWGLAWSPGDAPAAQALLIARNAQPAGRFASFAALCQAAVAAQVPPAYLARLVRAGACDSLGSRADLLAALPPTLEQAVADHAAQQRTASGGQLGMFAPPAAPAMAPLTSTSEPTLIPAEPDPAEPITQHSTLNTQHLIALPPAAPAAAPDPAEPATQNSKLKTQHLTTPPETDPTAPLKTDNSKRVWRAWERSLLGYAFTPPAAVDVILGAARSNGVARQTLRGITPAHVGQTVSVVAVLTGIRVLPAGPGAAAAESMAVALAEDADGAVPLVLFPPAYTRFQALVVPESPLIVMGRVQLAEAWEGLGAGMILIGEQLQPYQGPREEPALNVTPRKPRAPSAERPPAAAKEVPDPRQYSAGGQPYFAPPRPAPGDGGPPPAAPPAAAEQVVITLHALANEQEDEDRMLRLKAILVQNPGPLGVLLYFPDDPTVGGPTYMPLKRTVAASAAFCDAVDALLGAGCFQLTTGDA